MPALAVGRELRRLAPDLEILYIGAGASIEERLAKVEDYRFEAVSISPLRRGVLLPNVMVPFKAVYSVIEAMWLLNRNGAVGVFGSGGFSCWPACAAARQLRLPYFLEDGNAYPGLVTRLLAKKATRIYTAYEETSRHLKIANDKVVLAGIPVSSRIGGGDAVSARRELGLDESRFTILATGGSGGSKTINRAVGEAETRLLDKGFNLIWQTGKQMETLPTISSEQRTRLLVERFLEPPRMALALRACDLAITRCGMMSLAELAVAGKPAILIPFPYSAEGHQEANAKAVSAAGAGEMVLDKDFNADRLMELVEHLSNPDRYEKATTAMKSLAKPDAASKIAENILKCLG